MERHRTESLALELDIRRRYSEELERNLEEWTARLSAALSTGEAAADVKAPASPLGDAVLRAAPSMLRRGAGSGGGGFSRPALPSPHGRTGGATAASSSAATAAARQARFRRPVPRGAGATATPALSRNHTGSTMTRAATMQVVPTDMAEDSPLRTAGTGDTGEGGGSAGTGGPTAATAAESRIDSERLQLEAQIERFQADLARRVTQVTELASQLGARDVRIAALRHEVLVKDALLKRLGQDPVRKAQSCDEGLELLLQDAMTALMAVFSPHQAAVAAASGAGERAMVPPVVIVSRR